MTSKAQPGGEPEFTNKERDLARERVASLFADARRQLLHREEVPRLPTSRPDVVVCAHGPLDEVRRCLASLEADDLSERRLILVHERRDPSTEAFLGEFAGARPDFRLVVHEGPQGWAAAANAGIRESSSDHVVVLHGDTIVPKGWLQRLVRCAESAAEVGLVGPLSNAAGWQTVPQGKSSTDGRTIDRLPPGGTVDQIAGVVATVSGREYPRVPVLDGFCLLLKSRVIARLGLFDEESFARDSAVVSDYCMRALDAGFELAVADDAYVFHAEPGSALPLRRSEPDPRDVEILGRKHGEERIARGLAELNSGLQLETARRRIEMALSDLDLLPPVGAAHPFRALFLVSEDLDAAGTDLVMRDVLGMRELGVDAVAAFRGDDPPPVHGLRGGTVDRSDVAFTWTRPVDLTRRAASFHCVIATGSDSIERVHEILKAHPEILPAYHIQDYEPERFEEGSDRRTTAETSFAAIPGMVGFTKACWIAEKVRELHGVAVERVPPAVDLGTFHPIFGTATRTEPLLVSMTARHARPPHSPSEVMARVRDRLKDRYGSGIQIEFFGLAPETREEPPPRRRPDPVGLIAGSTHEIADLLRRSAVFLDVSSYQTSGTVGLEAMACGCAAVLPSDGGCRSYAVDGQNALLVDTANEDDCFEAARRLIEEHAFRQAIAREAVRTASHYSRHRAALSQLDLLEGRSREWRRDATARGAPRRLVDSPDDRIRIGALFPTKPVGSFPGSAFIRLVLPFEHTASRFLFSPLEGLPALSRWDLDVLFVQRTAFADTEAARELVSEVRRRDIGLIFEVDDALWDVPSLHPEHERLASGLPAARLVAREADLVTTASSRLGDYLRAFNQHVKVIPNALDASLWGLAEPFDFPPLPAESPLRLLYMGTRTHGSDLSKIAPALKHLVGNEAVELDVIGVLREEEAPSWIRTIPLDRGIRDYESFVTWLRGQGPWHVGLAPLDDSLFNRCKSWVKFLDYSALGLVTVASSVPYGEVIRDGDNGFLVAGGSEAWKAAFERLLERRDRLDAIRRKAYAEVSSQHTLKDRAPLWEDVVLEALKRRSKVEGRTRR